MRHRFHSICPYFAMFPETFVEKHLAASPYQGMVFDPFCGRGTSVFQAMLSGRSAAGSDVNDVALCISGAKCQPPTLRRAINRLNELEADFARVSERQWPEALDTFFSYCFSPGTLEQVKFLRASLNWKRKKEDRFIAAVALGALHGESHRSPNYFSNRMPRTISTKPVYSVNWWKMKRLRAPKRDAFKIIRDRIFYRFSTLPPIGEGYVVRSDVREVGFRLAKFEGRVTDIITSPPYLDTTNYNEDQWLRLWFLGSDAKSQYARGDNRHTSSDEYWDFMADAWEGVAPLLARRARIVVRIGGRLVKQEEARERLIDTLEQGLGRRVELLDSGISTTIKRSQANTFRGNKVRRALEHDFCFAV